eukprot:scaffold734_cov352-Prasinococcus_capsulatus_cf.AAC.1
MAPAPLLRSLTGPEPRRRRRAASRARTDAARLSRAALRGAGGAAAATRPLAPPRPSVAAAAAAAAAAVLVAVQAPTAADVHQVRSGTSTARLRKQRAGGRAGQGRARRSTSTRRRARRRTRGQAAAVTHAGERAAAPGDLVGALRPGAHVAPVVEQLVQHARPPAPLRSASHPCGPPRSGAWRSRRTEVVDVPRGEVAPGQEPRRAPRRSPRRVLGEGDVAVPADDGHPPGPRPQQQQQQQQRHQQRRRRRRARERSPPIGPRRGSIARGAHPGRELREKSGGATPCAYASRTHPRASAGGCRQTARADGPPRRKERSLVPAVGAVGPRRGPAGRVVEREGGLEGERGVAPQQQRHRAQQRRLAPARLQHARPHGGGLARAPAAGADGGVVQEEAPVAARDQPQRRRRAARRRGAAGLQ